MKQHIFTKGGVLLAFISVFLNFFACRQDQIIEASPPEAGADFKQSARQYYDNTLVTLRKVNIDKAKTDAHFTALDFTPDWAAAITHTGNAKTYLEVPVKFVGNSTLTAVAQSTATKFDMRTDVLMPTRLIISETNGVFNAYVMVVESLFPYTNGIVPEFNLFKKIDNFTGREYLYNLDGSFNKGWRHEKGKIVSTLVLRGNNSRQQGLGVRECRYLILTFDGDFVCVLASWGCEVEDGGGGGGGGPIGPGGGGGTGSGWGTVNEGPSTKVPVTFMCIQSILAGLGSDRIQRFGPWDNVTTADPFVNQRCHGFTGTFKDLQTTGPSRLNIPIFEINIYCPTNREFNYQEISSRIAQAYSTANANSRANSSDNFMNDWAAEFNRNISGSLTNGFYQMQAQSVGQINTNLGSYSGATLQERGQGCQ